jgi:hypothetical protein
MTAMKKIAVIVFIAMSLSSCFLVSKFRKDRFTYTEGSQPRSIPIAVPRGYISEKREQDSAGNVIHRYSYPGKGVFYVAYMADTTVQIQPINAEENLPKVSTITGAMVYKGMTGDDLFWREVRQNRIRFGYTGVPRLLEGRFDSATNYPVYRKVGM